MTCPFVRRTDSLARQPSVVVDQHTNWGIEDDFTEIPDALTLTHLQAAIQLLTSPLVNIRITFGFFSKSFLNFSDLIFKE